MSTQIHVKPLREQSFTVDIRREATVADLKHAITELKGKEYDKRRLMYRGSDLLSNRTLSESKVEHGSMVHLSAAVRHRNHH